MEDNTVIEHYVSIAENNQNENQATAKLREKAKQSLLLNGLPTKKDEEWQYTSLESWKATFFNKNQLKSAQGGLKLEGYLPKFDTFKVVLVDGVFNKDLSDDLAGLPKGCQFEIEENNPLLPESDDTFQALFALSSVQTLKIDIQAKAMLEKPLLIVQVFTKHMMESTGIEINVAEAAQCKVIQQLISINEQAVFNNGYAQVKVAKNAICEQFVVQSLNSDSFYFNNQAIEQASNSVFKSHYINLGSALARHKNIVNFNGEHCEAYQSSVVLGGGKQVADSRTVTNHNVPNCESYQLHKFVLDDESRGVFNGMIYVAPDAQKTNGNMDNKNLLLSNNARMNTKPQLEIYADDVLCSHGCTSGQINADQLFYCQARGISKVDAMALITKAFVLEPLDSIENPLIKTWLADLITNKLAKAV